MEGTGNTNLCDNCKLKDLLWNYDLDNVDSFSLFNEFLEMGTDKLLKKQDGFTIIQVFSTCLSTPFCVFIHLLSSPV